MAQFTYVRVPADGGEALEELTAVYDTPGEDMLTTFLRPRFAGGRIVNADALRAEFGEQVDARMGALNAAAKAGAVEVFALCRPSKSTVPAPHQGTYLYFDEMGSLKGLAVNPRAMSIARECGLDVESPFYGDCYIGRVTIEPAPLKQGSFGCVRSHASAVWVIWACSAPVSFNPCIQSHAPACACACACACHCCSLADLEASSEWMKSAPAENHMYDVAMKKYEAAAIAQRKAPGAAKKAEAKAVEEEQGAAEGWEWEETAEDVEVTLVVRPAGTTTR
eukprot:COSAG06_NODE_6124_length_3081_cov_1.946298_2_plen_279_part_00